MAEPTRDFTKEQIHTLLKLVWFNCKLFDDDPDTVRAVVNVEPDLSRYTVVLERSPGKLDEVTYEGRTTPHPDGTRKFMQQHSPGRWHRVSNGDPICYPPPDDSWWTRFTHEPELST